MPVRIPKPTAQPAKNTPPSENTVTTSSPGAATGSEYLTLKQVADQLQVCTKTARKIIKDNDIPVLRVGSRRQIRIHRRHVELFLDKEW